MYVSLQGKHVQFRRKSKQLVNFHQNVPGINFMIIPLVVHEFKYTTDRYVNCEWFHGRYIMKTKHNSLYLLQNSVCLSLLFFKNMRHFCSITFVRTMVTTYLVTSALPTLL